MTVVALDVGTKRIGVAVADPGGTFALPVTTIERTTLNADLERVRQLLEEYRATDLVIGDPLSLSGERAIASQKMDRFVEQVERVFDGAVHRVDERMTTAQATKTLIAADVSRDRRKRVVDAMAAALILETFLARRRHESER